MHVIFAVTPDRSRFILGDPSIGRFALVVALKRYVSNRYCYQHK